MGNCLVVDDEPDVERLIKQRFRHEIREGMLKFLFAQNGEEALVLLAAHPDIDMVLTDINMPKMDGLTLMSHIQDINPVARTVVVSAYGDMENIRTSMNRGAFDFIVKPINFEDLRAIMEKTLLFVEQIKQSLHSARENSILKMYVNPSIVHYLKNRSAQENHDASINKASTGNETIEESRRINGTVMFVDICNFTTLSETQTPENISSLLNCYFDEFAVEVLEQEGNIDKFIGDAALVVFEGPEHEQRCVEAAFGIINRIAQYQGKPFGDNAIYPGVSIGINSGDMIKGNFGSRRMKRLDYTVIGDTVNTASRLEQVATQGQVLITGALFEVLKTKYECQPLGELQLKNKSQAVSVYQTMARRAVLVKA